MPRPPRQPLTRERILTVALAIVDRDGLDALSMRAVGAAVGVEAMSLYNHVPSKAALLDGLHERLLEAMDRPRRARTWTAYAADQAKALRRVLVAHPNAVTLFATRPAATTTTLARLEEHLAVLRDAGFSPLAALEVVQCVAAFVVGHALRMVGPRAGEAAATPVYAALDPVRFPNVRATAALLARHDEEKEFARGLAALLRGFAAGDAG
jgi:TetR/AcrR family transcriptional regulator, tetracycline repressor protein